jgi:hypothetical protein
MFNETSPDDTQGSLLTPGSIVAITGAALSLIGSLATIIYVKVKSSFRDVQNSKIKIVSSLDGDKIEGKIVINLTNDENFATTLVQGKNGKESENNYETALKELVSNNTADDNDTETIIDTPALTQNYSEALQNNSNGDQIIAETRHDLIKYAFNAYLSVMQTLRVPLNEVANIKSLDSQQLPNNHLNGSIFFNVKEVKNNTQLKKEDHPPKVGLKLPPKSEEQEFTPSKAAQKKYTSTESLSYAKAEKTAKPTKNQVTTTTATLVDDILLLNDTDSDQEKKHVHEKVKKDQSIPVETQVKVVVTNTTDQRMELVGDAAYDEPYEE